MKLHFDMTVHNSIRVWMYFDEKERNIIQKSKEYNMFEYLSVWGGHDKVEKDMYSWELPLSLSQWIKERFVYYPDCTMQLL